MDAENIPAGPSLRCEKCGAENAPDALVNRRHWPFGKKWRQCHRCIKERQQKFYVAFLGAMFLAAILGAIFEAILPRHQRAQGQESSFPWILAASVFQWIMVAPHELGHALAARWLGYRNIRILIGSGRPVWQFEGLGFQWLVNRFPFGGLTLANPPAAGATRRKELWSVAAGPAVSLAAIVLWLGWVRGEWRENLWTTSGAFAAANLLILVQNLMPREVHTGYGVVANDGLLIWRAFFHWGQPPVPRPALPKKLKAFAGRLLRWAQVGLLFVAATAFGLIALLMLWPFDPSLSWPNRVLMGGLFLGLAVVSGKLGLGLAREPIRIDPEPPIKRSEEQLLAELAARSKWWKTESSRNRTALVEACNSGDLVRAESAIQSSLGNYPGDPLLRLYQAILRTHTGQSVLAEQGFAELLKEHDDMSAPARVILMGWHLQCVMAQNDLARFEQVGASHLGTLAGVPEKARLLDGLASSLLYRDPSAHLPQAEAWARQALALDPAALTLKGTLGAVLVESGNLTEAEPYLRACLERSRAFHDQGISAFYLAIVEAAKGDLAKARALARQATVLHHEPWLVQKATRKLAEWNQPGAKN